MLAPKDPREAAYLPGVAYRFMDGASSVLCAFHVEELWPKSLLDAKQVGQHLDVLDSMFRLQCACTFCSQAAASEPEV